jgi:hypothetical protein
MNFFMMQGKNIFGAFFQHKNKKKRSFNSCALDKREVI